MLTWVAAWGKRQFGFDIKAKHRDALHSAFMTGARLSAVRELTGQAARKLVLDYVKTSVPDALSQLAPSQEMLTYLTEMKLNQIIKDQQINLRI